MTIQEAKEKLVTWANAQIGTREGSGNYNRYAAIAESMRMYGWNVQALWSVSGSRARQS